MPYSNEQLVKMIQGGRTEYIETLWLQVVDLISMLAGKYVEQFPEEKHYLKDDCVQEAYFCFYDCIRKFDPSYEYKFTTYLSSCLKNPFRKTMFSGRGGRAELDLLNSASSLNDKVVDSEGKEAEIVDFVADTGSEIDFLIEEEKQFWKDVHEYMKCNFEKARNSRGKQIRLYMLEHDCTFRDAIRDLFPDALEQRKILDECRRDVKRADFDFELNWRKDREIRQKIGLECLATRRSLRSYGIKYYLNRGSFVEDCVIRSLER